MLKLKLQYFGLLMPRADIWKTLMLGKIEARGEVDDRGWDGWVASPTQWTWVWINSRSWWWTGSSGMLQSMGSQRVGQDWMTELNWTDPWKKNYDKPRQHVKNQRHYFADNGPSSQAYGFFSSHVWIWELDHQECWALKNWCFWAVVLEKTLESPSNCEEIKRVDPKGNQSWIFIGRTDVEAEAQIFWPPDAKNWLIRKDSDAGKDWKQEEKGTKEDEMVGWYHQLNGWVLVSSGSW